MGIKTREEFISGWYTIKYEGGRKPFFSRDRGYPSLWSEGSHTVHSFFIKTNHTLLPSMAVPVLGITPVTPNKNLHLSTRIHKIMPGVPMTMIINMEIFLVLLRVKRISTITLIFHIPWWGSIGT